MFVVIDARTPAIMAYASILTINNKIINGKPFINKSIIPLSFNKLIISFKYLLTSLLTIPLPNNNPIYYF